MNIIEMDQLDQIAASAFPGYLVRKDLVRRYSKQYPVPTYVVEFLLGRYCASTVPQEIEEGLEIVEKQLQGRTVRTGNEELFKARARENGSVRLIDIIRAKLNIKNDTYEAEMPSLALNQVQISDSLVRENERMLTDGFYAEVTLEYDPVLAEERHGNPFRISTLRPIQMSNPNVLNALKKGRQSFTTEEWKKFLMRSAGLEPELFSQRALMVVLLRMIPFVEKNYNLVEIGPRGTGKSHLYQQISPYSHLVSGGKATVAKMFVNNSTGQRGLVCQYDVVCFDEISGISFDSKDGVNIMKGYMESGEFSRARESIRAEGCIVMVGNFDVDVEQQQRIGHLLGTLPAEMRDDTAFHDRLHAFVPGWDFPKLKPKEHLTDHFGLVTDFLSECWSQMRESTRISALQNRIFWGGALSGRDINAVQKTISGLVKLIFPDPEMPISDDDLEEIVKTALESRRRIKEQQKRCLKSEFRNTHFSYTLGVDGVEQFVGTPELHSDEAIDEDPLPPGQVWCIGPGTGESGAGLYRIEATSGPGSGIKILNHPKPPAFNESVKVGEQNLYTRAKELTGNRDPRGHEYSIQLRPYDSDKSGTGLGFPVLAALAGSLLERNTRGGTILVGQLNLGGSVEMVPNPVAIAELAIDKQASTLLMPVAVRRNLNDLPDELWTKINIEFYSDPVDGIFKALAD
ncbi:MAG: BREX system Lon protease-like protein BrxL [Planctomycetaceae bacterium]|nr:BREX system Lon protease-like protein BrxL [Planctomycetaceae bacterium]MBT6198907.1 BREX system Lon protease-like protein BrxL [Bacteroidetes Order II. bacterium]